MKQAVLIVLGCLMLATAHAASFDCAKARTNVEKMICGNDELSKLDDDLGKAYSNALNRNDVKEQAIKSQRQWLKIERNVCLDVDCIKKAYQNRLKELELTSSFGITFMREPPNKTNGGKLH